MYTMSTKQVPSTPVMFCHDSTNIYYPTAPGRVYIIGIAALADCDGSDEDYSDSTSTGSVMDIINASYETPLHSCSVTPMRWPTTVRGTNDEGEDGIVEMTHDEAAVDFFDALEQWADWCDRDSVRLDSLDEIKGAIERAA